jgi:pimeloyl-ACP methyl ester carboxylesterase
MPFPINSGRTRSARHTTDYLSCGAPGAPLVILVHGWPERAISWRHQLSYLAELGFLAVAPDMRGYGSSSIYPRHEDYAVEQASVDMLELLASFGQERAIWIGHDWGSPVVWSIASHHPEHCIAIANLCVPYQPGGFTIESLLPLIDRTVYPADRFPAGQWEYFLFYREQFARVQATLEASVTATVKALFRSGRPDGLGKPAMLAYARIQNGWFGGATRAPDLPMDPAVLDEASMSVYVEGLQRNGFFGPGSWYLNDELNGAYAKRSVNGGRLGLPVLFLHGRYDYTCETMTSPLAQPMRANCTQLTEAVVDSGHWMAQEQPAAVNGELAGWLSKLPGANFNISLATSRLQHHISE